MCAQSDCKMNECMRMIDGLREDVLRTYRHRASSDGAKRPMWMVFDR